MDKTRQETIKEWLAGLYVPAAYRERYDALLKFLRVGGVLRSINRNDAGKSRYSVLEIETHGNAPWVSFYDWYIRFVDFGEIGSSFALAYVRDESSENGIPKRIAINGPRYSVIM